MEYRNIIPPIKAGTNGTDGFVISGTVETNTPIVGAFDKDETTSFRSRTSPVANHYIQVNFPKPFLLGKYSFLMGGAWSLKTWDIQGLINGNWQVIHSGEKLNTTTERTEYEITPILVSGIRIVYKTRFGDNSWTIAEADFYELIYSQKILVEHNSEYKTYNKTTSSWEIISNTYPTEEQFLDYGIDVSEGIDIKIVDELHGAKLLYYTDSNCKSVVKIDETEPFSVYDYISENPQAIIYTESTDDITVSTTTEPYDLYDEFGDEIEVLFYTDDESVTETDLILEANWSPVDELEGDFEVVTWTDEGADTAQRVLEMTAIPKPQFVKLVNPKRLYGYLDKVWATDSSTSYRDEARYLFTDENEINWYVWDFKENKFVTVDTSTNDLILKNGMKWNEMDLLTQENWRTWESDFMNIGIFLKDNPRDTIVSVVDNVSYQDYLPRHSTEIEKANFYILNTTAKIDINITGNTIEGVLSDDDLTRVQYRVLLNGDVYFPLDGSFTELSAPPQNLSLAIPSKDIKIDDWNSVRVEFKDSFGTVDYWQTSFLGTYSGLMFKDITGDYYSNEIGEMFKYLDFGIIVAGQTTIEHEIILKNQYGYDIRNLHLYANTSNFPNGMSIQFSKTLSPFDAEDDLVYIDTIENNDELSFYVRISTELGATPNANGLFDIIARADRAY